jgi:hypothetical protein
VTATRESLDRSAESGTSDADVSDAALSRPARVALVVGTSLIVTFTAIHLVATFFYLAPSNALSDRYHRELKAWMRPYFDQNWRLFAPNPTSVNVHVLARARAKGSGPGDVTAWVDISESYRSHGIVHNPFPDHQAQDALVHAWEQYTSNSSPLEEKPVVHTKVGLVEPDRSLRAMIEEYFNNLALRVLQPRTHQTIEAVQVQLRVDPIRPRGSAPPAEPPVPTVWPWRPVRP